MSVVQEGFVEGIIDLIKMGHVGLKTGLSAITNLKKSKNVKQLAKKNTVIFPVLATDNISTDTMVVLLKSLERTYVGFLQIVLSQNNYVTAESGNSGLVGLLGESVENVVDLKLTITHEQADGSGMTSHNEDISVKVSGNFTSINEVLTALSNKVKNDKNSVESSFFKENWEEIKTIATRTLEEEYNMENLNKLSLPIGKVFTEAIDPQTRAARLRTYHNEINILSETIAEHNRVLVELTQRKSELLMRHDNFINSPNFQRDGGLNALRYNYFGAHQTFRQANRTFQMRIDEVKEQLALENAELAKYEGLIRDLNQGGDGVVPSDGVASAPTLDVSQGVRGQAQVAKTTQMDMKKYSDMQPTILDVTVSYQSEDGSSIYSGHQAVAVKMNPHFTPSSEMLYRLADVSKNKGIGFKFIQWSSGEISLFKDLILGIKQSKKQVSHDAKNPKLSKFWRKLYDGNNVNVIKATFGSKKSLPTATLVISHDDELRLKNEFGVNLRKRNIIGKIFDSLLLYNLLIVDEDTGEVDMWDDDENEFVSYKIAYIKQENGKNDNIVKSILDYSNRR